MVQNSLSFPGCEAYGQHKQSRHQRTPTTAPTTASTVTTRTFPKTSRVAGTHSDSMTSRASLIRPRFSSARTCSMPSPAHWARNSLDRGSKAPGKRASDMSGSQLHPTGTQLAPKWHPNGTQMAPEWHPNGTQKAPKWHPAAPNCTPTAPQLNPTRKPNARICLQVDTSGRTLCYVDPLGVQIVRYTLSGSPVSILSLGEYPWSQVCKSNKVGAPSAG